MLTNLRRLPPLWHSFTTLTRRFQSNETGNSPQQSNKSRPELDEDPIASLKLLRKKHIKGTDDSQSASISHSRHAKKNIFFESADSQPANAISDKDKVVKKNTPLSNEFLEKLTTLDSESREKILSINAGYERRKETVAKKIQEERKDMLVFRNLGMDLDKPILSRDVFLIYKYFRYGVEFAIDNELERMLRYFNEHALNELKIIQHSKLMRGPPSLSRKKRAASTLSYPTSLSSSGATPSVSSSNSQLPVPGVGMPRGFQVSSLFPSLRCALMNQFCRPFEKDVTLELESHLGKGMWPGLTEKDGNAMSVSGKRYSDSDDSLFTTLSPSSFRRPAMIIITQLGQQFGAQADQEWRYLAYQTANPSLLKYFPESMQQGKQGDSPGEKKKNLSSSDTPSKTTKTNRLPMPLDVISLRTMDIHNYKLARRLYVSRFAKFLDNGDTTEKKKKNNATDVADKTNKGWGLLLSSTTYVGPKLVDAFFEPLGLRNYLSPYVLLIDQEGTIRWMSAGLPDSSEKQNFPRLLAQLEIEYLRGKK